MIVDFEPLLCGEKKELSFDYTARRFPDDDIGTELDGEFHISGKAVDLSGYIRLELTADVPYRTICARCAKELSRCLHIEYNCGVTDKEIAEDNLDYEILENGKLDIDELVQRCFILELPMTDLCSEDCLGLCSECGKDLNEGPCSCKKSIDPRLQKIIDAIEKK